ncbi:hypothetical protein EYC80_010728 [Monilinia laxa]|uniref:Uncharacterized protein n=1 Tax=Monilinia laxa TaxID=61186 RepID=A0A5N6JM34_MONLA|nr:hypothetical protein EYC80_010728 [Monilinia laxa]
MADNKGRGKVSGQGEKGSTGSSAKDASGVEKRLSAVIESLYASIEGFKSVGRKLEGAIEAFNYSTKESQNPNEELKGAIEAFTKSTKELQKPNEKLQGAIEAFIDSSKELRKPDEKLKHAIQELTNSVEKLVPDKNLSSSIDDVVKFTGELKTVNNNLSNNVIKLLESTDKLRESDEKISSVIQNIVTSMKEPRVRDKYDIALNRAALEAVDGKPAFVGLIHLEHSSKSDENPNVWQGITLHAHDRPFTVRVLMQHIQTVISNLHPKSPTSGIELTKVSLIWDNVGMQKDASFAREYQVQGRGEADESGQENALVGDSLDAMMVRGGYDHIYVRYRLNKVDHAEWCGQEHAFGFYKIINMST